MGGSLLARRVEPRLTATKQALDVEHAMERVETAGPRSEDQDAAQRLEEAMRRVEETIASAIECQEPLLQRIVADLVGAGGKRLRPRIALLAFDACGGNGDSGGSNAVIDAAAA